MRRIVLLAAAFVALTDAHAQEPIRIGMINVTSGQFADAGIQLDNGVKTYMHKHGDMVAGRKIEISPLERSVIPPERTRSSLSCTFRFI